MAQSSSGGRLGAAFLRVASRPGVKAALPLFWVRLVLALLAIGSAVAGIISGNWWWLFAVAVLVGLWGWWAAILAEREIMEGESKRAEFRVEWEKAPALLSDRIWFSSLPPESWLVSFILKNPGARFGMKVRLVSRSVIGVNEEYPQGDQYLRWDGSDQTVHPVTSNASPRVDVGVVAPSVSAVRFLGPGKLGPELTAEATHIRGRIVVEDDQNGYDQTFDFILSVGTEHPPGIDLHLVE